MPLSTEVSDLAVAMGTECKSIRNSIGALNSLSTTDKTTIVAAINEVRASAAAGGGDVTTANITDATTLGRSFIKVADAPAARGLIGASTVGSDLITAATAAAARTTLGAGATGSSLFAAATSAAARTTLGATTTGTALFTAADAPAARTALGATATGSAVLIATDAAAARTAIGGVLTAAEVDTRIANVVNAAPAALDTLDEIAAALGDDANFAGTMTTALANRVRVDAAQALTAPQQLQARQNIGAVAAADIGNTETDFVAIFQAALL